MPLDNTCALRYNARSKARRAAAGHAALTGSLGLFNIHNIHDMVNTDFVAKNAQSLRYFGCAQSENGIRV